MADCGECRFSDQNPLNTEASMYASDVGGEESVFFRDMDPNFILNKTNASI